MIRLAQAADASGLSRLLTQLEYPGTETSLPTRLETMLTNPAEIILVWAEPQPAPTAATPSSGSPATRPSTDPSSGSPASPAPTFGLPTAPTTPPGDRILAFLSLHFSTRLATGDFAEITYFAVDETAQSKGIGRQMEAEATRLAQERHCDRMVVHCHTRRTRAHDFYFRQGYEESPKYLIKRLS